MRKLVTLRQVFAIEPIEGADAIEVAVVDGWKCVVKKGEFQPGDRVFYFEIDSILPYGQERFAFLMARGCKLQPTEDGDLLEGHRLRTIKLRGQVSQGLVLPIDTLNDPTLYSWGIEVGRGPFLTWRHSVEDELKEIFYTQEDCNDFSEVFGVKKYEKPIPAQLAGMIAGNYPGWLPKTDQERIQNVFHTFPKDVEYCIEEKLEGSSMTVYWDGEKVGVTSRNLDLKLDQEGNTFVDVAKASGLLDYLAAKFGPDEKVAFRGELIGPGIQENIYKLASHQFHIFDVFLNGEYLLPQSKEVAVSTMLADELINTKVIDAVPVIEWRKDLSNVSLDEIVNMANGESVLGKTRREGLVFKSHERAGHYGPYSFKSISPEYLLKEKE